MGQAIAVRTDFTAGEVRQFAKRRRDAAQARRLLAIAAVLDGVSREDAAKIGGMDRQTLRDRVIRFNEQGPDGLIKHPFTRGTAQAGQKAQVLSGPARGGGPDPSGARCGALAGVRSDHAVARGIRPLGVGRHDLSRPEGLGLLPSECAAESLQAGS